MTTKQIAESVGKDERSVQRWAKSLSDKMSSIADKMSSSHSSRPADYDLDETCRIIEEGLGQAAADVYRTNAALIAAGSNPTHLQISGSLLAEANRAFSSGLLTREEARKILGFPSLPVSQETKQLKPPLPDYPWTSADVVQHIRINPANLRTLLHRNPSVRTLPWTEMVGGRRTFLQPFVEHLASAYGYR